jgi:hypothetical protein
MSITWHKSGWRYGVFYPPDKRMQLTNFTTKDRIVSKRTSPRS